MRLSGTGNNCGNGRRKISNEACEALLTGKPYKKSNTEVRAIEEPKDKITWIMELWGNPIAHCRPQTANAGWCVTPEYLQICDGQHQSMTTKERLNALPNVSIHQRNFQWYINDCKWDEAYNSGHHNLLTRPPVKLHKVDNPYGWIDVIVDYKPVDFTHVLNNPFRPVKIEDIKYTSSTYEELRKKYRI